MHSGQNFLQKEPFNTITFDPGSTSSLSSEYSLTVRQHPKKARLCSFKEKVDRRPLDPPPIVQLHQAGSINFNNYWNSANFFLLATLIDSRNGNDIHVVNDHKTTAGTITQSLNKLRDTDNREGAFFIFSDISIRLEGIFRLKFTLFQINGLEVHRMCSVISETFQVYSPKSFPGMSESTDITRLFSEQGVRIRIRKEARMANILPLKRQHESQEQHEETRTNSILYRSNTFAHDQGPKRASIMSMQNLLTSDTQPSQPVDYRPVSPNSPYSQQSLSFQRILPLPLPTITYSHIESNFTQSTNLLSNLSQNLGRHK